MKQYEYVRLDEVLALIPENDIIKPKPSYLRQEINKLFTITLMELEPGEYDRYINNGNRTE